MIFYKTSSFGNDFIEIDRGELDTGAENGALASAMPRHPLGGPACPEGRHPLGGLAAAICDRQRGVGADGVVFFRIEKEKIHFEIFNRDGGRAELSGNGMAGLAAVLFQRRLAPSPVTLHTASGRRQVGLLARRGPVFQLNVEIGRPDFSNRRFFPFLKDKQDNYVIDGMEFYPVSVGNPHAVVICQDALSGKRLENLGKKLEGHPMFPKKVNVEFVNFTSAEKCRVFFYERGVGPTLASSTGSAAVFAVLRRLGKVRDRLAIDLGAEKIHVSWNQGIFIHNITRLVCRGNFFG